MKIYRRRSIRLKHHDYSDVCCYFVTITTRNRLPLFGVLENRKMKLNQFGLLAEREWLKTLELRPEVSLGEFIVMPDHLHMILHIDEKSPQKKLSDEERDRQAGAVAGKHLIKTKSLSTIIRGYKGTMTRQILSLASKYRQRVDTIDLNREGALRKRPHQKRVDTIDLNETGADRIRPHQKSIDTIDPSVSDHAPIEILNLSRQLESETTIWTRNYYEKIISSDRAYKNIEQYIIDNPIRT